MNSVGRPAGTVGGGGGRQPAYWHLYTRNVISLCFSIGFDPPRFLLEVLSLYERM